MSEYEQRGIEIRKLCKSLVLHYMQNNEACKPGGTGVKQIEVFRDCGFDWGDYKKVSSTNQSYWAVVILRALEEDNKVKQLSDGGPWTLC